MDKKYLLIILMFPLLSFAQAEEPWVRFPALSPDGSQVAFSYQGDIWTMPTTGGIARRLTIHEAYEANPLWSEDGEHIAFSSNRYGNNDVFVMNANGGKPERLTWHSTSDLPTSWTKNKEIIFTTRRNFVQLEREPEIHQVSAEGGTPARFMDALGSSPAISPNGRFIAFERGSCRISREAYRGPAQRDIWLYDTRTNNYTQLTTFDGQDIFPKWGDDQTLYYLSAENGKYNIHRLTVDRGGKAPAKAEAITNFTDDGIRYFDVSANGSKIAFERQASLFQMDATNGKPAKVAVDVTGDYRFDPIERKTFTSNVSEYAVSPNEEQVAFVIRGEIFVTKNDDKSRTVRLTDHPYRDQEVAWLNDTTLVFTSDRDGQHEMYLLKSSDQTESSLFESLRHEVVRITKTDAHENSPVISPDGQQIAYREGRGTLVVADISAEGSLSNRKVLSDDWATPSGVSWSPDSKWLAYSKDDLSFNEEVYIHIADNSQQAVNISLHPKGDQSPVWSQDGSKLGFLSARNNGDNDVWFVWLKKEDWEKTRRDWEETEVESDKKKDDKEVVVEIDFEDIHDRLAQVTALPAGESDLAISKDGEYFYFVTNRGGRQFYDADSDLYKIKWDGTERKALTKGNQRPRSVAFGPKGKELYMLKSRGQIAKLNAANGKSENVRISASMSVNYPEERKQIFEEAWRTLNLGFYDPNFHGQDFDALKKKYHPWAMKASTHNDFMEMFNDMLGQLNASHMGLRGAGREETQRDRTGLLGIEVKPEGNAVTIAHIVPNSPADRTESKLNVGEKITAVNDQPLASNVNFYSLFTQQVDERIILEVENASGAKREVIIRPSSSMRRLLYEEWVKEQERLTNEYSGGRLGYVHIQGMNWPSFERFERELTASGLGKEGIVIDVRYNGGGWTTDYLMAVLTVRQHAYTVPRGAADNLEKKNEKFNTYYPYGERLPLAAWTKPSIALCNENSYSNAEIFSHAYKTLGIGTLVGRPTFGAVISTGGQGLIDGSFVRLPFRAWYVKATGENMEHGPAVPNIEVFNAPDSKAKGQDAQLKRAVEELLQQIDTDKTR